MESRLRSCRVLLILGLAASILLLLSTSSAGAAQTYDPMAYPASTDGSVMMAGTHADPACTGSVVSTPGATTVVMTGSTCVTDPVTGEPASKILFVPGHVSGALPYGIWTAASTAVEGDTAFLILASRKGWSLKQLTGSVGVDFGPSSGPDLVDFSGAQASASTQTPSRSLFESVGGDPAHADPAPAPVLAPKLWVHTKVKGGWPVVSFGIGPDYPIAVHFTCKVEDRSAACRSPMSVPAGTTMTVEASYGVAGHLHFIGRRTITVGS